jgi:hypothetical protein
MVERTSRAARVTTFWCLLATSCGGSSVETAVAPATAARDTTSRSLPQAQPAASPDPADSEQEAAAIEEAWRWHTARGTPSPNQQRAAERARIADDLQASLGAAGDSPELRAEIDRMKAAALLPPDGVSRVSKGAVEQALRTRLIPADFVPMEQSDLLELLAATQWAIEPEHRVAIPLDPAASISEGVVEPVIRVLTLPRRAIPRSFPGQTYRAVSDGIVAGSELPHEQDVMHMGSAGLESAGPTMTGMISRYVGRCPLSSGVVLIGDEASPLCFVCLDEEPARQLVYLCGRGQVELGDGRSRTFPP